MTIGLPHQCQLAPCTASKGKAVRSNEVNNTTSRRKLQEVDILGTLKWIYGRDGTCREAGGIESGKQKRRINYNVQKEVRLVKFIRVTNMRRVLLHLYKSGLLWAPQVGLVLLET
jgi:hypothetical protein